PQPYSFAFDNTDEFGTRLTRQETGDEFNGKVGSYSYTDAAGVHRTVNYVADAAGFRATVDTNEPGTKTSEPADAATLSAAPTAPVAYALGHAPLKYTLGRHCRFFFFFLVLGRYKSSPQMTEHHYFEILPRQTAPTMFSKVRRLFCGAFRSTLVQAVPKHEESPPQPYTFGFDNTDEFGTRLTRQETGDEFNGKVGSYSYTDAAGVHRTVNYVADAAGFRATVDTNEPGTKTSEPANAATLSTAVENPNPVVVKAARP
ncbi:unnamed protein product, partial [Ixodes persulcatus]